RAGQERLHRPGVERARRVMLAGETDCGVAEVGALRPEPPAGEEVTELPPPAPRVEDQGARGQLQQGAGQERLTPGRGRVRVRLGVLPIVLVILFDVGHGRSRGRWAVRVIAPGAGGRSIGRWTAFLAPPPRETGRGGSTGGRAEDRPIMRTAPG